MHKGSDQCAAQSEFGGRQHAQQQEAHVLNCRERQQPLHVALGKHQQRGQKRGSKRGRNPEPVRLQRLGMGLGDKIQAHRRLRCRPRAMIGPITGAGMRRQPKAAEQQRNNCQLEQRSRLNKQRACPCRHCPAAVQPVQHKAQRPRGPPLRCRSRRRGACRCAIPTPEAERGQFPAEPVAAGLRHQIAATAQVPRLASTAVAASARPFCARGHQQSSQGQAHRQCTGSEIGSVSAAWIAKFDKTDARPRTGTEDRGGQAERSREREFLRPGDDAAERGRDGFQRVPHAQIDAVDIGAAIERRPMLLENDGELAGRQAARPVIDSPPVKTPTPATAGCTGYGNCCPTASSAARGMNRPVSKEQRLRRRRRQLASGRRWSTRNRRQASGQTRRPARWPCREGAGSD